MVCRSRVASLALCSIAASVAPGCDRAEPPRQSSLAHWTVDSRPVVEIGAGEGEGALYRVTAATRLPDGRIAVANAGTQQVKIFSAQGEHLASLGQRGSGPGEFQVPLWVGSHADSILVWDAALERLTVFDADGGLARTTPVSGIGGSFPSVVGAFADGTLLLASGTDTDAAARREGAWRGSTRLVRITPAGRVMDTLATVPSQERYSYRSRDGMGQVVQDLPFGRRTVMAVASNGVALGTGEEYRIRLVDTAGTEHDLLRAEWTPRPVTPADIREYWARMVTIGRRPGPAETDAQRARIEYPATLPPYERLLADPRGALWIMDAQPPEAWDDPGVWRIFSASGGPMATIQLPARARPQQIGEDWFLSITRDDSDRELVRLYRYQRG